MISTIEIPNLTTDKFQNVDTSEERGNWAAIKTKYKLCVINNIFWSHILQTLNQITITIFTTDHADFIGAKTKGNIEPLHKRKENTKTGIFYMLDKKQCLLTGLSGYLRILVKLTTVEYMTVDTAGRTNIGSTRIALICQVRSSFLVIMMA